MKKILSLLALMTLGLTIAGCTNGSSETYTLSLEGPSDLNTALSASPEGPYSEGETITITATWDEEKADFVRWEEGDTSLSETPTFAYTIKEDATLKAVFENKNTLEHLDLTSNTEDVNFEVSQEAPFEIGETLNITPEYNEGTHTFIHWTLNGAVHTTDEALVYTVNEGDSLQAVFERMPVEPQVYEETFENFPESGSQYSSGSFIGDHGIEWTYTGARGDKNIDGTHALTFGDTSRNPSLKATLDEGIHSFSVEFLNAFTGDGELALYINGDLIEVSGRINNEIAIFEVDDIDIKGTVDLELKATHKQTIIDNMVFENYVEGSDYPEVTFESTYWDAQMHALPSSKLEPGSEVTVTASDPEGTYAFVEWQDSEGTTLSSEREYTFTLQDDTLLVSVFDNPERFDLDLTTNLYNAQLTQSVEGPIIEGTPITLALTYPEGPHPFLGWFEGDTLVSAEETFDYTLNSDVTLNARFDVPEAYDALDMDALLSLDLYSDYDELETLYGSELEAALQGMLSDMNGVTYDDARTILNETDRDPENPENVVLTYTRLSTSGEWGGSWNREHVWPQSLLGVETDGSDIHEGSDLHNLVPTNPGENSARGNQHFGSDGYMPPEEVRGDLARMLFYMAMRYDGLTLVDGPPSTYEMGDLETLLEWHLVDPVDTFEYTRNDVIETYQGNRNPFIDYPHLAYLIYYEHPTVDLAPPSE